jgi:hypothetical protein
MNVEYDNDGTVTLVENVTEVTFVENGTKALLKTETDKKLIPLMKILSISIL